MKTRLKIKSSRSRSHRPARPWSGKGDIARAMFARWEKDHVDPQPVSWEHLQLKLEANRLRESPLFSK
jgi:hypothetical protein